MLLKPTTISTERLTFDKVGRLLVAEDSDLPAASRVWDDACDTGYTVVSQWTGREVVYATADLVSRDGDILYWDYRPISRRDEGCPTLRVFND